MYYFTWKNTPYGIVKISDKCIKNFTDIIFKSGLDICNLSLNNNNNNSESNSNLTVVISGENIKPDSKIKIEEHLQNIFKPMGFNTSVIWVERSGSISEILINPFTWGFIVSSAAIIICGGLDSFFWTSFWGAVTWFVVRVLNYLPELIYKFKHHD